MPYPFAHARAAPERIVIPAPFRIFPLILTLSVAGSLCCICGCLAVISKALLRGREVPEPVWAVLGAAVVAGVLVWIVSRSRGGGWEMLPFIASRWLGSAAVCMCVGCLALPGFLSAGIDLIDVAILGLVALLIAWFAQRQLQRHLFTPPDSPEDLDQR